MAKPEKSYRKRELGGHVLKPESMAMSYGYDPAMSEGAIKPPVFMTSTFAFRSAAEGEALFRRLAGRQQEGDPEDPGLIYTRFNNPNMEVLEDRLTLFDDGEDALVFSSGMGAITTALLALCSPGTTLLHTSPLYGASEVFIRNMMPEFGIRSFEVDAWSDEDTLYAAASKAAETGPVSVIYTESPANPTNTLVDMEAAARVRDRLARDTGHRAVLMCDNTMMGPVGFAPLGHGADLVVYSLTKYIGGHSDLIAGGAVGREEIIARVRRMRNFLGTTLDSHTCWLLTRSVETLGLRMQRAFDNARVCAQFLSGHDKVSNVRFPALFEPGSEQRRIYDAQCKAAGSTFSFDVAGGKEGAFRFLDSLQLVKLAVSLGGTESLACHPGSTTHSGVDPEVRERIGFTEGLVRLSVGIEDADDLVADLEQALAAV